MAPLGLWAAVRLGKQRHQIIILPSYLLIYRYTYLYMHMHRYIYKHCFFIWKGNREETKWNFPPYGLLSKYLQQPRTGQIEIRTQELILGLPCGWRRLSHLSHYMLIRRMHISRKLALGLNPGSSPGSRHWGGYLRNAQSCTLRCVIW